VTCERRGNHEFGSQEVERLIGDRLVDEWRLEADLATPEQYVNIEIFQAMMMFYYRGNYSDGRMRFWPRNLRNNQE
jgi:tRNA(Ser,Leu) C12 N-acetylase TAN1